MVEDALTVGDDHDSLLGINLHGSAFRDKVATDATDNLLTVVFGIHHAPAGSEDNPVVAYSYMPDMHFWDAFHASQMYKIGRIIDDSETKLFFNLTARSVNISPTLQPVSNMN